MCDTSSQEKTMANKTAHNKQAEYYGKLVRRAIRYAGVEDVYNLASIAARLARRVRLAPRNEYERNHGTPKTFGG